MLLIIGGHPRSGTTMARDLLNRHPEIYVTAELPMLDVYPAMMGMLETADRVHRKIGKYGRLRKRKERLIKELWFGLSKFDEDRRRFASAKVLGNKTPGSELYFDQYEDRIGYLEPRYIYCLRDPVKVIASNLSMPWSNRKFDVAMDRLRGGYRAFQAVRDRLGDRLMIFRVDDFAGAPAETCRSLCGFLGVSEDAAAAMAETPPSNTSARYERQGQLRKFELSDEQIALIRNDPAVTQQSDRDAVKRSPPNDS